MKNKTITICTLGLLCLGTPAMAITDAEMDKVLSAIRIVESNNNSDAVGDSGKAIGVYQIWDSYWKDACNYSSTDDLRISDGYKKCFDADYADKVVRVYMTRHANERRLGRVVTMEDVARMHNGGPRAAWAKGKKKENLNAYWNKVKAELSSE